MLQWPMLWLLADAYVKRWLDLKAFILIRQCLVKLVAAHSVAARQGTTVEADIDMKSETQLSGSSQDFQPNLPN